MKNISVCMRVLPLGAVFFSATLPGKAQDFAPEPTPRRFPIAGACISQIERLEALSQRRYLDFKGKPTDPIVFLAENGFNTGRVGDYFIYNLKAPKPNNGGDVNYRERNFLLDKDGLDRQVRIARRLKATHQKVVLTLHFGEDGPVDNWHEYIPKAWLSLTYAEVCAKIAAKSRVYVGAFLDAGIQPDIIIIGNESNSGLAYQYLGTDGKMHIRDTKTHPNDTTAGGEIQNYPKFAGFFKAAILSAKATVKKRGYPVENTLFAVHASSNAGVIEWMSRNIFGTDEEVYQHKHGDRDQYFYVGDKRGPLMTSIPAYIRNVNLRDVVDIMGGSFYPRPPKAQTKEAYDAAMAPLVDQLNKMRYRLESYSKYTSGPRAGHWKKRFLVVEFGSDTDEYFTPASVAHHQHFITYFWNTLAAYPWTIGAMWWEPTYCNNNWFNDRGSLYRHSNFSIENPAPTNVSDCYPMNSIQTWGMFSMSNK